MTDAEIKQNLKFIAKYCKNEYNEIRVDELLLNALDLINRQQAEIEKLKDSRDRWKRNALSFDEASRETEKELEKLYAEIERLQKENNQFADFGKMYSEIKAETIKGFAERLKENFPYKNACYTFKGIEYRIDNLVKEMVGGAE